MRNMSFALTTSQFRAQTKDVTRRLGWLHAKPGDFIRGVVKCKGLKPGEKIQPLGVIKIVSVRRERLDRITKADVIREGFPDLSAKGFVFMFCKHMGVKHDAIVTRIEFRYIQGHQNAQLNLLGDS